MAVGSTKFKNSLNLEPQSADPSSPSQGDIFYSDGTSRAEGYWQYKAGAWSEFGGAGSGGINYLDGDNSDFENGVGDWAAYADAAATTPADGTGGSPTTTFAQSADTSLRGSNNGLLTKDAANRQGEGTGVAFTIDAADKAKKLTISFDYLTSANYADDDIKVFVYDVTNASLIRVNGEDLKANANSATHYAQFQAAPDSTSYRLILHISSTNASAYTVRIDNVKVGPTSLAYGTVVTDWEDYTPSSTAGFGLSPNTKFKYRRIGDSIEIEAEVDFTNTGGGLATLSFTPPSNVTLDSSKMQGQNGGSAVFYVGSSQYFNDSTGAGYTGQVIYNGTTFTFYGENGAGLWNSSSGVPVAYSSNTNIKVYITYPVAGWSSNAQISEDLGGREIRVRGSSNGGGSITANVTDIDFTEVEDTTASWSGTVFTAPETGSYQVEGMIRISANNNGSVFSYINGTQDKRLGFTLATANIHIISGIINLTKGDQLSFRKDTSETLIASSDHHIHIQKLASPQTQLASETVAAEYTSNAGQAVTSGNIITFEDLVKDTHNAYNTSTGVYTVPITGFYSVTSLVTSAGVAASIGQVLSTEVFKNGSVYTQGVYDICEDTTSRSYQSYISKEMYLVKGDTIDVRFNEDLPAVNLNTGAKSNYFSIARIK